MEIKYGTSRVVILVGEYAFKFCRFWIIVGAIKRLFSNLLQRKWRTIQAEWKLTKFRIMSGIQQNRGERYCWKKTGARFLVPTRLSLGFLNVQQRERGDVPTSMEIKKIVAAMTAETSEEELSSIDFHCLQPGNFLRNEQGYRLLDYGSPPSKRNGNFTDYLIRWHKELEKILC